MNGLVRMAQVTSGASAPVKVKIVKPSDGTAQVIQVAPGMVLDLQDLASQDVVMVHAGDRLIILFPDSSAVVLKGFFGPDGQPIAGLDVDLGRGAPIPAIQLASLLPISDDQNLLPAAGPASPAGNAPNSALHVSSVAPDALGDGGRPLDLLTGDNGAGPGGTNGFSAFSDTGRPNTPAVIGGQAAGAAKEDDVLSITGALTVTDPDAGQARVVEQPKTIGLYGTFAIKADGTWTYVLDNALTEVQALGEGRTLSESFTVTSTDGTATQIVTITIKGTNDVPVLGGEVEGTTVEDTTLSTPGMLTIADVDTDESHFIAQTDVQGLYGKFTVDAAGNWTFVLDNDSVQSLGAERSATDSFVVTSADGSASQTVTVTIYGTNDVPVLGGETTGTTKEDTTLTASGVLTIADVDTDESQFVAQTDVQGLYGTFSVDADGNWTYTLNNGSTAVQQLGANSHLSESFTVWSADLSVSQTVMIAIDGTNDVPIIGGTSVGSVKEDTTYDVTGILTIVDADLGESSFSPQFVAGIYGSLSIDANGFWIYTLNNSSEAVQSLGANSHPTETFTVTSSDGSASQTVTVMVNGKNDAPTLYGVTNGSVTEDGTQSAGNNLYINDRDTGEAFYDAQTTAGTYGTFSVNANGQWTYTLNNSSAAVQALGASSHPTETFKVWSADHSASLDITVTVNGANDVPTLGGTITGAVIEDKTNITTGNLTISDSDSGQSSFIARSNVSGTYGTFSVTAAGAWTYTLNNSLAATQRLDSNSHPNETFTVTSADGTATSTITITVNGTNDAPSGANKTVTTLEDTAYTFSATDFAFTDTESNTLQGVKITQLPSAGTLTLNGDVVSANQIVSASDIASGFLVFTPASNGNGAGYANFKFAVQDNGGTTNGGLDTDQSPNTFTFHVTGVSDAPSGTDATLQAYEDTPYTFKASDFGFADVDGNTLVSVKFTQLPGAGTIKFGSNAVVLNQIITIGNINAGLLTYSSASNASGDGYASFQFAVQDNGSTNNIDQTPNTLTFNVGAVNDAPAGANKTVTATEDSTYTFATADFPFSDTDGNAYNGIKITSLPAAGSLTLNNVAVTPNQIISADDIANGLLKYAPAPNGSGFGYTTFQYAVRDNGGTDNGGKDLDQTPNLITINVTNINDAPILDASKNLTMTVTEDAGNPSGIVGVKVSAMVDRVIDGIGPDNFTDVDSFVAGMAITGVNTSAGTLYYSFNNGGSWSALGAVSNSNAFLLQADWMIYFKPAANYSGTVTDAVTIRAWDGTGTPGQYVNTTNNGANTPYSSATDTISVTVTGTNDTPVAQAKSVNVSEDGALTAQTVVATDGDNDPLTYSVVGNAPAGLTFNADGTWSYAPPASYQALNSGENGAVTFQYKANDGTVDSNTATVTVTITGANDAPVAQDKAVSVSEDGTLTGQAVMATDVDVEALSYAIVGNTPAGLTFNANGTWSYAPPASMQALDDTESVTVTFQYKANDGTVDSNVATVTITVNGANDAPVAQNRSATVFEDDVLTGPAAFATDADVETLTYAIFGTTPAGLAFNADGTWTYTPPASFQSIDDNETQQVTFQYVANDGTVNSAPATVTITVKGQNDAPVAQNGSASVSEDGTLSGQTVAATDIDVEGLSYAVFGAKPDGLTFNANGTWSYSPPSTYQPLTAGQAAEVTFQYTANDGTVDSVPATVIITINGANETPTAQNASAAVSEDGALTGQQVTASDGSGTPLTYTQVGALPAGVSFNADGTWSYTPASGYQSLDDTETATLSFQYKASNGAVESNTATVTITINGANDKPVAQSDTVSVSEDGAIVGRNFMANDVDVENLTYAIVGAAPAGLTLHGNGTWSYTPPAATFQSLDDTETATVTFQYKANDGTAESDPMTVTITITGANDAPVTQNNTTSVSEDGALTGRSVTAIDADIETLTYALTGPALDGLTFNTDGTWSYTPPASYQSLSATQSQTVSFQYQAYDGTAYSNVATQSIVIQGANDAPVARPDTGAMLENQGQTEFNVLANDTLDPDSGAPNTITAGPITIYGGSSYGIDANDVSVVATADGLRVTLLGTDWDRLSQAQQLTMTINYTLAGDQGLNSTNQFTLTVNGVNDAPVLDASKTLTMTVNEDAPVPSSGAGTAISNFIGFTGTGIGNVTDVDSYVSGIAITGVNTAAGTWYWSATGTGWTAITGVSNSNALLLSSDYKLYFRPNADYSGTIEDALTFRAWDRSGNTTPGTFVDTTTNGGSTAYSFATDTIRVTVVSDNDPATISGQTSGTVKEDAAPNPITGDLNSVDPDGINDAWQVVATPTASVNNYGTFTIDAAGHWAYTLNNANPTVDALPTGSQLIDSFTVRTEDGTAQVVTVTIDGTNDAAIISGTTAGSVTEDATPNTASGVLTVIDPDAGQAVFAAQNATTGTYGTFSITTAGVWTYTLNNANPAVDALKPSQHLMETFTAASADGTVTQQVQITINGTNDAPVITQTGSNLTTNEDEFFTISVSNVFSGANPIDPDSSSLGIAVTQALSNHGTWFWYTPNNVWTAIDANVSDSHALLLNANDRLRFVPNADDNGIVLQPLIFRAWDQTSGSAGTYVDASVNGGSTAFSNNTKHFNVLLTPVNDPALISGNTIGAVTEAGMASAGTPTATGDLNSTDIDNPADDWQAVTSATATTGGYGTYTLSAAGVWVYTLNNANPTVNGLAAGATLTDIFTVKTADGTSQVVTMTITGADDAPVSINLDNIALSQGGFKIVGENAGDNVARSIASAGDVNGDGYDDIIFGTDYNDASGSNAGAAYVIYGRSAPLTTIDLGSIAANNGGFKLVGLAAGDFAGNGVASAGDFNGDGYDDLIVGAYGADGNQPSTGTAYIIYGQASPITTQSLANFTGGNGGFKIIGENEGDMAGLSVASAGDINNDGYDDIIVSAWQNDAGGNSAGAAYVIYGTAAPITSINLNTIATGTGGFKITGQAAGDAAGTEVASAGDVNGDGYADMLVSATGNENGSGAAYIIYGQAAPIASVSLQTIAAGTGGFKISGENPDDHVRIIGSAGDINGDGYGDVLVGSPGMDDNGTDSGASYVVYGGTGITSVNLDDVALGNGGFKIIAEDAGDAAGQISLAGDLNGDGYLDILIGAAGDDDSGADAGAAYVIYGRAQPFTTVDLAQIAVGNGGFKILGEGAGDQTGSDVAAAGDINGDGFDDILVSARLNDAGGSNSGAAYVIYGGQNLPNNTASHIAGTAAGMVTEDDTATVGGALTATQANQSAGSFTPANVTGSYGSFALLADGTWTYTLNNANGTVNALNDGQHLTESFNVFSADGTATETITVTINGADDVAATVNLTEDVTHVFTAADFAQTAGGFQGVTVDPMSNAAGKLMLGNVTIVAATYVTAAQLAAGMLTWAPADDVYGAAGDAEITFRVRDTAGIDSAISEVTALEMSNTDYVDISASNSFYLAAITGANQSYVKATASAVNIRPQVEWISFTSFDMQRSDNNLEISWTTLDNSAGTITLLNHFDGGAAAFAEVIFSNINLNGVIINGGGYTLNTGTTGSANVSDAVVGSSAAEVLEGNSGADVIFGAGGNDTLRGSDGNDSLFGGDGDDTLSAGDGNDLLFGGDGNDAFIGAAGADRLFGGDGNDTFNYGLDTDLGTGELIDGGAGIDTLLITPGNGKIFNLHSGATINGVEHLSFGEMAPDTAETLYVAATIWAGFSSVAMGGGADSLRIAVTGAMDISNVSGPTLTGVDTLSVRDSAGDDTLTLSGTQVDTYVWNGFVFTQGNDTVYVTSASSRLSAGYSDNQITGLETISAEHAASGVSMSMAAQNDAITLKGSAFDDVLTGGSQGDRLEGGAGNDTMTGGAGADFLLGDIGADILTGDAGADTFAYTAANQGGDTIKDFGLDNDMIGIFRDLLGVTDTGALQADGTTVAGSTILFEAVGSASAAAQNNSAKLIYDTANRDLYYDSDGGASASARILLAHLENGSLDASHIALMS